MSTKHTRSTPMGVYNKDLPEDPKGFTSRCAFHMSYESNKKRCGRAVYEVVDADGVTTPVVRRYDTGGEKPYDGYFVDGCETKFSKWADAARQWNNMRTETKESPNA